MSRTNTASIRGRVSALGRSLSVRLDSSSRGSMCVGASVVVGAMFLVSACKPTAGDAVHPTGQGGATASSGTTASGSTSASGSTTTASGGAPFTGTSSGGADVRPERCATDAECIVTDFVACCAVCGRGDQRADLARKVRAAEASCAAATCAWRPPVACQPPRRYDHARAVCRAGVCELEIGPRPTEGLPLAPEDVDGPDDDLAHGCHTDSECAVSTFDGCCTACDCPEPHPILKRHLARERDKCRVVECQERGDKLCERCPARAPMRPACRNARCVLVK